MSYIVSSSLIADGCRGVLGQVERACSLPAVRAALSADLGDDALADLADALDDDALADLADALDGLDVPGVGTLEWRDGDLFAVTTAEEDGWCCADCAQMIAIGEAPPGMSEEDAADLAQACAGYCLGSSECEGHEDPFSWQACDCCRLKLGGARYAIHRLPD